MLELDDESKIIKKLKGSIVAVRYKQQVFPWAHQSRRRKRHLDRFSRFCRAHWVIDRLTD